MDISDLDTPRTSTPGRSILRDSLTESVTTTRTRFTIHSPVDLIPLPATQCTTTTTTTKSCMWNPNFDPTSANLIQELKQVGDCRSRNRITPSPTTILGLRISPFRSNPYITSEIFTRTVESRQEMDSDDATIGNSVTLQSEQRPKNLNHFGLPNAAGESTLSGLPTEIQNTNFSKGELNGKFHFDMGQVLTNLNEAVIRNYGSNLSVHKYPGRRNRVVVRLRKRKRLNRYRTVRNKATPSLSPISKILLNSPEDAIPGASVVQSSEEMFGSNLRALDSPSRYLSPRLTKVRKLRRPSTDSPMRKTMPSRYDGLKSSPLRPPSSRRSRDSLKESGANID